MCKRCLATKVSDVSLTTKDSSSLSGAEALYLVGSGLGGLQNTNIPNASVQASSTVTDVRGTVTVNERHDNLLFSTDVRRRFSVANGSSTLSSEVSSWTLSSHSKAGLEAGARTAIAGVVDSLLMENGPDFGKVLVYSTRAAASTFSSSAASEMVSKLLGDTSFSRLSTGPLLGSGPGINVGETVSSAAGAMLPHLLSGNAEGAVTGASLAAFSKILQGATGLPISFAHSHRFANRGLFSQKTLYEHEVRDAVQLGLPEELGGKYLPVSFGFGISSMERLYEHGSWQVRELFNGTTAFADVASVGISCSFGTCRRASAVPKVWESDGIIYSATFDEKTEGQLRVGFHVGGRSATLDILPPVFGYQRTDVVEQIRADGQPFRSFSEQIRFLPMGTLQDNTSLLAVMPSGSLIETPKSFATRDDAVVESWAPLGSRRMLHIEDGRAVDVMKITDWNYKSRGWFNISGTDRHKKYETAITAETRTLANISGLLLEDGLVVDGTKVQTQIAREKSCVYEWERKWGPLLNDRYENRYAFGQREHSRELLQTTDITAASVHRNGAESISFREASTLLTEGRFAANDGALLRTIGNMRQSITSLY